MTALSLGAFTYLGVDRRGCGLYRLHLAPASLRSFKVATYAYVNPVVAVLLGALFAGETPDFSHRRGRRDHRRVGRGRHHGAAGQGKIPLLSRPQLHNGSETG